MTDVVIDIADPSGVAHARREVVALTEPLGWSDAASGALGLAVTEAATNQVKHAGSGTIVARRITAPAREAGTPASPQRTGMSAPGAIGIEVVAFDRGPGIANLARSLRDGHSTAGSPGLGLGSMARLAHAFDIWSHPGRGTVLRFAAWAAPPATPPALELGVMCVALRGERACGDAWAVHPTRDGHVLMVVDGLGHGTEAASAARAAQRELAAHPEGALPDQIARLHDALRPTRGAAASLAALAPLRETGTFCGIGNVAGLTRVAGRTRSLVSHNGTLGHQLRKVQAFDFPFPAGALLVLHSDGIATSWRLDDYPGIEARHPALIAAVLYRDHRRSADDATVLVARNRQRRA
jgi:anti-sigma regulatory factor (Ser/Thr protein kinase)